MENTIILTSGEKIEVLLQDEVSLDIDCTLRYIKSGKKEIKNYVENTTKPQLDNIIEQTKADMTVQIAEGIEDAKAAAETAATTAIADSIVAAEQQICSYVSQNITPDLTSAVNAAESSKDAAAGSATTASNAASQAEEAATNAVTAKNEAVSAASLATQKATEAASVTEKVIPPLLSFQFADHILNNASWLRADNFSWASGDVYVSAYEHLVADIAGITTETETIGGYTVTFYRATDGHKICLADQESTVADIYTATGVAWYYILDIANTRFKLPRTKFGVTGLRSNVGDYVEAGLPNITGAFDVGTYSFNGSGAFYLAGSGLSNNRSNYASATPNSAGFDASFSSSIYGNSTTVQPPTSQMYLYFYVGETVQNANLINAGQILSQLNSKADTDLSNVNDSGTSKGAGWAMPSDTYEDLTLGADGSTYTAPANGYVQLTRTATNGYTILSVLKKGTTTLSDANTEYRMADTGSSSMDCFIPVEKGRTFGVAYGGSSSTTVFFRFIYAVGSESEA